MRAYTDANAGSAPGHPEGSSAVERPIVVVVVVLPLAFREAIEGPVAAAPVSTERRVSLRFLLFLSVLQLSLLLVGHFLSFLDPVEDIVTAVAEDAIAAANANAITDPAHALADARVVVAQKVRLGEG